MLTLPNIDPIALELGPLKVHWYGLMYVLGFAGAWWLGRWRAAAAGLGKGQVDDLIFYGALGVVLGGRLGSVFFYNFSAFVNDPLMIVRIWEGGMSFHGGLLGVLAAMWLYARKLKRGFFEVTDFIAPLVPVGLLTGRLGNFINGELWGRPTDLPWATVFPYVDKLPRHPSQLYEAALEGVALFVLLWWFSRKPRPVMAVSAVFLIGYGSFRFLVEFAREPDAHLGFIALDWMSMGQLLSLPMIIVGLGFLVWSYRKP